LSNLSKTADEFQDADLDIYLMNDLPSMNLPEVKLESSHFYIAPLVQRCWKVSGRIYFICSFM